MRRAFSLVELSIILVILGLLVGGILAGQSLIRAAELRSVSADVNRYKTAIAAFRDKYNALPGDITNATTFWGAADGNNGIGSDCERIISTPSGTATCNGNGSGIIGEYVNSDGCTTFMERYRMWQHLVNAGILEGNYTGQFATTSIVGGSDDLPCRRNLIGINTPASRIANAGFEMVGISNPLGGSPIVWDGGAGMNRLYFGTPGTYIAYAPILELFGPAITPTEAWNIDMKMDDGMPYTGVVQSYPNNSYGSGVCNSSNSAGATYALATTTIQCALAFKMGI